MAGAIAVSPVLEIKLVLMKDCSAYRKSKIIIPGQNFSVRKYHNNSFS